MTRTALIALASICLLGAPAVAQDGATGGAQGDARRGQVRQRQQRQLDPAQAKVVWTLEARSVASRLELDEAQSAKVVEAYLAARTSLGDAQRAQFEKMRELRRAGRGDDGDDDGDAAGDDREAMRERFEEMREAAQALAKTEREKLEKSLGEVLSGEKLADASNVLGSFNVQWDRLVDVVVGFEAGEEKTMSALAPIETYVTKIAKLRAADDRETARGAMGEAREELHAALSYVLTEPQVEKVLASMRRGGRRGPGGERERGQLGRDDA